MAWFGDGDGIYRVVMQAVNDLDGDTQVNAFHYRFHNVTGATANDPQTLADLFRDNVFLPFAALYTSDWTIQKPVVVQEKDPLDPTAPRSEWTSGAVSFGDRIAGSFLPRACVGVATLRTASIGRRSTGRKFLGGSTTEGEQDNGQWQASILALWDAYMDSIPREPDLATGPSTSAAHWCVYSRTNRAAAVPNYAFDITDVQIRSGVHWLRSRSTV